MARSIGFRADWREAAACRGIDPKLFVFGRGDCNGSARQVCAACTVTVECLCVGLLDPDLLGVWGGFSEQARVRIRRFLRADRRYVHLVADVYPAHPAEHAPRWPEEGELDA